MVTVNDMLQRVLRIDVDTIAEDSLTQNSEQLLDLNKEQMLEGKRSDGSDITPGYLDDPFFKSKESAQRYSDWKDKITPNAKRKKGTPNLFINGRFHRSIEVKISKGIIRFDSSDPDAGSIEQKFKLIYGLNSEKRVVFISDHLWPTLIINFKNGLKQ